MLEMGSNKLIFAIRSVVEHDLIGPDGNLDVEALGRITLALDGIPPGISAADQRTILDAAIELHDASQIAAKSPSSFSSALIAADSACRMLGAVHPASHPNQLDICRAKLEVAISTANLALSCDNSEKVNKNIVRSISWVH